MIFPELEYISWAKSQPPVDINLARSGIDSYPPSLLRLKLSDLGFANWIAIATSLDGAPRGAEVIVERPTYEPLLKIPRAHTGPCERPAPRRRGVPRMCVPEPAAIVRSCGRECAHHQQPDEGVRPRRTARRLDSGAAHRLLDPSLETIRGFFAREPRLQALVPGGGNVAFPGLPRGVDSDAFAARLVTHYSTLVVPGRFFESPRHIRIRCGTTPSRVARGLANISSALDDLMETSNLNVSAARYVSPMQRQP